MMIENAAIKGTVNMVLRGPDGRVKAHKTIRNKVMNAGIAHIVGRMINPGQDGSGDPAGQNDFPHMMRYMGIGTGTAPNLGAANTITGQNTTRAFDFATTGGAGVTDLNDVETNLFQRGFDLESGGFVGSEYRLQNEVTTGQYTVNPQDVATFEANGTLPATGLFSTTAEFNKMRNGRIDMGFMNYGTYVSASGTNQYRFSINFEDVASHGSGVGSTVDVQRGEGDTTMLFQGDVKTSGTLVADTTKFGNASSAEGTTLTVDGGGQAAGPLRINSFDDLYGFFHGFHNGSSAAITGWGNTVDTSGAINVPEASSNDYKARVLDAQKAWLAKPGAAKTTAVELGGVALTLGQMTVTGTTGSTWVNTPIVISSATPVIAADANLVVPAHQVKTVLGTGSKRGAVTAATGFGSPTEKRHHRAVYTNKKLGKRLVFVALFPPKAPLANTEVAITEAGIFNHPTGLQAKQTMLCRTVFSVVTKQPEDSLQITWSIAFNDSTPA